MGVKRQGSAKDMILKELDKPLELPEVSLKESEDSFSEGLICAGERSPLTRRAEESHYGRLVFIVNR
jgi:hypothetical protein